MNTEMLSSDFAKLKPLLKISREANNINYYFTG